MVSRQPPDFPSILARLASELDRRELPFMLIGGQAVLLHGRPRLTEDIDITLGRDPGALEELRDACDALDLDILPEDASEFVRSTFVLPAAHRATGLRVDFIFSTTPYERQAIERADRVELEGTEVPFASAEDLILHKLFAGRARDLDDAASVVRRKGATLDWEYLTAWADEFTSVPGREDLPGRIARLRREETDES